MENWRRWRQYWFQQEKTETVVVLLCFALVYWFSPSGMVAGIFLGAYPWLVFQLLSRDILGWIKKTGADGLDMLPLTSRQWMNMIWFRFFWKILLGLFPFLMMAAGQENVLGKILAGMIPHGITLAFLLKIQKNREDFKETWLLQRSYFLVFLGIGILATRNWMSLSLVFLMIEGIAVVVIGLVQTWKVSGSFQGSQEEVIYELAKTAEQELHKKGFGFIIRSSLVFSAVGLVLRALEEGQTAILLYWLQLILTERLLSLFALYHQQTVLNLLPVSNRRIIASLERKIVLFLLQGFALVIGIYLLPILFKVF